MSEGYAFAACADKLDLPAMMGSCACRFESACEIQSRVMWKRGNPSVGQELRSTPWLSAASSETLYRTCGSDEDLRSGSSEVREDSPRRPHHLPATKNVAMKMRNGFATIWPVVDHQTVPVLFQSDLRGDLGGLDQEMT